jgi:hypothetical protein
MSIPPTPPNNGNERYSDWLRVLANIRSKTRDPIWIHIREPWLYRILCKGVNTTQIYISAIETLDKVLPVLRGHRNFRRWKGLVTDSISLAMPIGKTSLKAAMFVRFGEFMIDEGDHITAKVAADIARENIDKSDDVEIQLRYYILILKTQPQREMQELVKKDVYHALKLAKQLRKYNPTRASLYQALADIYSFKHKTRASNCYARAAYRIWRNNNNKQGKIACLIISANNARHDRRYARVDTLLNMLEEQLDSNNTLLSHASLLYIRACSALEQNEQERAIQDYIQACTKFEQLSVAHMIANCHHSMALTYAYSNRSRLAKRHLAVARRLWKKAAAHFRLSDILIAQSYLARMSHNIEGAMILLARASEQISQIQDADLRQQLEGSVASQAQIVIDDWNSRSGRC